MARDLTAGNMRDKARCTVGRIVARNRSAGNMRDKVRCTVGRIVGRDRSVGEYEGEGSLTVRWMSCGKGPIMREGRGICMRKRLRIKALFCNFFPFSYRADRAGHGGGSDELVGRGCKTFICAIVHFPQGKTCTRSGGCGSDLRPIDLVTP